MPYIHPEDRQVIDPHVEALAENIADEGHLNYVITRLIGKYLIDRGLHYSSINEVAGVLQKVAAEFDERVTRPYEDLKIGENGDVPEYIQIGTLIRHQAMELPAKHVPDNEQVHG